MIDFALDLLATHIISSQLYPLVMALTTLSMAKLCLIFLIVAGVIWLTREWKGR